MFPEFKKHTTIAGPTGSGKSYTAGALIEQLYRQRRPFVIFDTKQINHIGLAGLKDVKVLRVDSDKYYDFEKALNYDYLLLVPTARTRTGDLIEIYSEYLDVLYDTKRPGTAIIEEAHHYQKSPNVPHDTLELLTREGRGYNMNVWFLTQRIQDFPKLLWSQCAISYVFKAMIPQDIRYIDAFIPHFQEINRGLKEHDVIRYVHTNNDYKIIKAEEINRQTQHLG